MVSQLLWIFIVHLVSHVMGVKAPYLAAVNVVPLVRQITLTLLLPLSVVVLLLVRRLYQESEDHMI